MLHTLFIETLHNKFWQSRTNPPLTEAYESTLPFGESVLTSYYRSQWPECFDELVWNPKVIIPIYTDINAINIGIFTEMKHMINASIHVYTDGSKNDNGVGSAFFVQETGYSESVRINGKASIFSAELIAIKEALKWISNNRVAKVMVASDSKSALLAIKNIIQKNKNKEIIRDILHLCHNISKQTEVSFIWCKGHCDIEGNVAADTLAKEATNVQEVTLHKIPYTDPIGEMKKKM